MLEIEKNPDVMGRQKWKRVEQDMVTGVPASSEQPRVYVHPCVQLFMTPWTIDCQAPLPKGFPWLEYQSCHFLLQGIFLTQGSNPHLLHLLH